MSMLPSMRRLLAAAVLSAALPGLASAQIVISQVYGGGGNSGATYNQKYVELFNRGASSASLSGLSLQYGSATGNFSSSFNLPADPIPAGSYYLVGLSSGGTGVALPVDTDVNGALSPSGTTGKIALFNATTLQGCGSTGGTPNPCSPAQLALIVDLVGYGGATLFEGTGPAPTTSSTAAATRIAAGCTDDNQNAADFALAAPAPRNSDSPINSCAPVDPAPEVASTIPADAATDIALDAALQINFSEAVNLADPWFTLECPVATPLSASFSGAQPGTSFTITPDADLPAGTVCTVTILASAVSEVDAINPPDTMVSDYVFTFTTVPGPDPQLSIDDVALLEGDAGTTSFEFTVTLTNAASGAFSVDFTTVDGTATVVDGDYVTQSGTLDFDGTDGETRTITVSVNGDTTVEPDETFSVVLSNTTLGSVTVAKDTGVGTILNDDVEPPLDAASRVVISQVYGGGGNSGATYNRKYVEIFNGSKVSRSLADTTLQYASATGTGNFAVQATLSGSIGAGEYRLVGLNSGSNGDPLPVLVDFEAGGSPAAASGKYVLVNSTTALACNGGGTVCSPAQQDLIIDLVGYGSANYFEGSGAAPTLSSSLAAFRQADGCTDTNDNASDFLAQLPLPRSSVSPINLCEGLSIDDVTIGEGNSGTRNMVFTVRLLGNTDTPFSVDYDTADISATAPVDYESMAGFLNFAGSDGETHTITVVVNGDTEVEADETFSLSLSNVVGADVAFRRATGTGTILNDDGFTVTPIHAIQGDGDESPLNGQTVVTRGIVTGLRNNSFYIQTPDAEIDGNSATSEGLYVFVGTGNVPASLAVGDLVYVAGEVTEFITAADIYQLPITELVNVTTIVTDLPNQPLPAPIVLSTPLDEDGGLAQLERFEFMRVTIPEFVVTAPTRAAASDEYFGVIAGNVRPFREPGVDVHDQPLPIEAPANVPFWDSNPELIRVKSNLLLNGQVSPRRAGTILQSVTGVLDYSFRRYTVLTTAVDVPTVMFEPTGSTTTSQPLPQDITIGGFNVENFTGTGGVTFTRKADKISAVVREYMHYPDILGIIEVASPETLAAAAGIINADAVTAGDPDPGYTAHVVSTSGTQRLGFLLKTAEVLTGVPRVELLSIEERGAGLGMVCPDGSITNTDPGNGPTGLLNDRAPLVMKARVNAANDASYELFVINNHLKSLIGVDSRDDATGAYACFNDALNPGGGEGRRNRAKRQQNAEYHALLVDELQQDNPGMPIVLVGDFNAFEFNDGYADLIGTIAGLPSANDTTVVPDDGLDLLTPDLFPLALLVNADERYSYVFGGSAQVLDHVLVNEAVIDSTVEVRKEFARVNADFSHGDANDTNVPFRSSDHDPTQAYLTVSAFFTADLNLTGSLDSNEAEVGDSVTFALALRNNGASDAVNPRLFVTLPPNTGFVDLTAPAGWSCMPPVVGASGTFSCFADALANAAEVDFTAEVELLLAAAGTTVQFSASADADSTDPTSPNLASDSVSVAAIEADLALAALANAAIVTRPDAAVVVFSATSNGPDAATNALLTLGVSGLNATAPTPTVVAPAGWNCGAFAVAAGVAEASCSNASLAPGSADFTVSVATGALVGSQLAFSGDISSETVDSIPANNTADASVVINTAPVANNASFIVQGGAANGSTVGTVSASDADLDTLSFSITAGNTGGTFAIASTGVLTVANSNALTGSFSLTVTVTDGRGGSATAVVTVEVNSAPVASDASFIVQAGAANGSSVGTVSATDTDPDTLAFSITAGNTDGAFAIASTGVLTVANSNALTGDFILTVAVTDGRGGSDTATIALALNAAPVIAPASFTVRIGRPNGFEVGQLIASDDDGDELVFSIASGNTDGAFAIDAEGVITVANSVAVNGDFSLDVTVDDGRGGSASTTVTITAIAAPALIFADGFESK